MNGILNRVPSLVLDTNIVLSGLIWRGAPYELVRMAKEQRVELFTSWLMLYELQDVLERNKWMNRLGAIGKTSDDLINEYLALTSLIEPEIIRLTPLPDMSDNKLLSTAVAAQVDVIVTRDKGVLSISSYEKIPILNELQTLEYIRNKFRTDLRLD